MAWNYDYYILKIMKYFFIILCLIIVSCKSVEKPYSYTSIKFEETDSFLKNTLVDNKVYLNPKINGDSILLLFDTGATATILSDQKFISENEILESGQKKVSLKNAVKKNINVYHSVINDFKLKSLHLKEYDILVQNDSIQSNFKFDCFDFLSNKSQGVLGLDAFLGSESLMMLNFEEGSLSFIDRKEKLKLDQFKKVRSSFKYGSIWLQLRIGNVWDYYLFDTGAEFFMSKKENPFKDEILSEDSFKSVNIMSGNSIVPSKTIFYKDQNVYATGLQIDNNIIQINKNLNSNILGYEFIKNYNWIIDFKKNKVYAKKIKNFNSDKYFDDLEDVENLVAAMNGKLIVIYSRNKNYVVGDIIRSVNGEIVTYKNICEIEKLLLSSRNDWSELEIKF